MYVIRLRSERGGVLALSAVIIPVFLLLTALILDAGNWYTHKRSLQNRADAGALAAGVEYTKQLVNCAADPTTATAAITAAAKRYAGESPGDFNRTVNNESDLAVRVNAASPTQADFTNGNPCEPHLSGDAISQAGWVGTDVIVQERNIGTLGRMFGLNLPSITARARVEVTETSEGNEFVPLAIPEQSVDHARIRFVNVCNGSEIASSVLKPLDSGSQTVSGMSLWGPDPSGSASTVPPGTVSLALPSTVPVPGTNTCGNAELDYTPIRVELRLAGRPDINLSNTVSCAALQSATSADCYPSISQIRVYQDSGGLFGDRPQIRTVSLTPSGTRPCGPDVYYSRSSASPDCTFDASVFMDWGSRPTGADATFTASIQVGNGAIRTLTGPTPQGEWTAFQIPIDELGPDNVRVNWRYELRSGSWAPGGLSNCRSNKPCVQSGTTTVHQANLADDPSGSQDSPSDVVGAVKLTLGPSTTSAEVHQGTLNATLNPYVTVGLRTVYQPGDWAVLRLNEGQRNYSVICDPWWSNPSTGSATAAFYYGCQPPYAANDTTRDWFWWSTASQSCPPVSAFMNKPTGAWPNQVYTNSPWRCVQLDPGGNGQATGDGIALATGNCTASKVDVDPQPGDGAQASCKSHSYSCNNDAHYFGTGNPPSLSDPRVVKLFIVPWNAYKGVKSGNKQVIPVLRLAAFYITAWKFNGREDPCAATNPQVAADVAKLGGDGKVAGYFVKAVESSGRGGSTKPCVPSDLGLCSVDLVR